MASIRIFVLLALALFPASTTAAKTFFEMWNVDYDMEGEYVNITDTRDDLSCAKEFLGSLVHTCYFGYWEYDGNFGGTTTYPTRYLCARLFDVSFVHRIGPLDTATEALIFHEDYQRNWVVEDDAIEEIVMIEKIDYTTFHTYGYTDWMVYEGQNFSGRAACLRGSGEETAFFWGASTGFNRIGSARKGCETGAIEIARSEPIHQMTYPKA